jgi:hypothetical protein
MAITFSDFKGRVMKAMDAQLKISNLGGRFVAVIVLLSVCLCSVRPSLAGGTWPKNWTPDTGIQGGELSSPAEVVVPVGGDTDCKVNTATDSDLWEVRNVGDNSIQSEGHDDDTVNYSWSANGPGGAGSFDNPTSNSTKWTAPQTPGTYFLICNVDDLPKEKGNGETGSRDDLSLLQPITVHVVRLRITQEQVDVTDSTQNTVVGCRIRLATEIEGIDGATGLTIGNPVWNIPEKVVRDWSSAQYSTFVLYLQSWDRIAPNVYFSWVDGGTKQVSVFVYVNGIKLDAATTFSVTQATVNGSVHAAPSPMIFPSTPTDPPLFAYQQSTGPGFLLSNISITSSTPGDLNFVQVINNTTQTKTLADSSTVQWHPTSGADRFWYGWSPYVPNAIEDSPGNYLFGQNGQQLTELYRNDSFTLTAMFKSTASESIWVPLKKVDWGWQGSAYLTSNGTWALGSGSSTTPTAQVTTTYPIWNTFVYGIGSGWQ